MMIRKVLVVCCTLAVFVPDMPTFADKPASPAKSPSRRWEGAIAAFEKRDKESPPKQEGILFVGSSSIRMWELDKYFPGMSAINRGFGGSQIADSIYFADRIILPYKPKIVVLYAGDNDIAKGKSPQQVAKDYREFVQTVHEELPDTRIVFVAIKPSIRRWNLVEKMREANALVLAETKKNDRLEYVDVEKPMIGEDGKPRKELFIFDGLHLSAEGYKLWTDLVQPHLDLSVGKKR